MIIGKGEKIHVMMRRMFEGQVRRHLAGEVLQAEGSVVRVRGFVFIYDETKAQYVKKANERTTILDLSESGYIVNVLPESVIVGELRYETIDRTFLVVVDGRGFSLDINEFGVKR
jgi:hypothetical protein